MAGSKTKPVIAVRALTTLDEFREAVRLQKIIWGFEDIELLPVRLFVVGTKIGGQAFGGFDGDRMIAFGVAIPGMKAGGKSYLHSHMLGVLEAYRDRSVGRMIKLAQREDALARGIDLVEWTFDPLEIKNAYFNIERLGAVVRRYVINQYGTTSSHLHGGLPTDRCIAEWWVGSDWVKQTLSSGKPRVDDARARIEVPTAIERLRREEPRRAKEIQAEVSRQFQEYFSRGLAVIGLEKTEDAGIYLLGEWK